jgi:hypothetical protein
VSGIVATSSEDNRKGCDHGCVQQGYEACKRSERNEAKKERRLGEA